MDSKLIKPVNRKAYEPKSTFMDVCSAKYEFCLHFAGADAETAQRLQTLYTTSPLYMTKKTKSGDKEIDIVGMIRRVKVVYNEAHPNEIRISAILSAGNSEHLNPEFLIKAAKDHLGILCGDPKNETYSILRTHIYLADDTTEFR